jgi:hypothetical protein
LVVEISGRLSFDALQMRLHPAESRVRKLSAATPARFVLFDMLAATNGRILTRASLTGEGPCSRRSERSSVNQGNLSSRRIRAM